MDEYSVEYALKIHREMHLVSGFIVCVGDILRL